MFMLIMQFFWKYIDDLMGKGLGIGILLELLFYVSASLIPLALPLAMLLSSIMTMGNLAENNELTALKSSGLSLYRILRPLTMMVLGISLCTFLFANYVIPVANLKWRALIYDIQDTKFSTLLSPGKYNNQIDGFSIKIDEGTKSKFNGITIHDHRDPKLIKTVKAESGEIFKEKGGKYILFNLKNGSGFEEDKSKAGTNHFLPSNRYRFSDATYKIEISGFDLNKSDENLFKNNYEMLNVFQINSAADSIQKTINFFLHNFSLNVLNGYPYYVAKQRDNDTSGYSKKLDLNLIKRSDLNETDVKIACTNAINRLTVQNSTLKDQKIITETSSNEIDRYYIEFHRKFALTVAIIVLFFVGAPLGAIVKKGGFGAPVVIAALLFMIYFVLISIGESLAAKGILSPFWGMWLGTFILIPLAVTLMISAANDRPLISKERFSKISQIFKKRKKNEGITYH